MCALNDDCSQKIVWTSQKAFQLASGMEQADKEAEGFRQTNFREEARPRCPDLVLQMPREPSGEYTKETKSHKNDAFCEHAVGNPRGSASWRIEERFQSRCQATHDYKS